jgi:hypothetical protein
MRLRIVGVRRVPDSAGRKARFALIDLLVGDADPGFANPLPHARRTEIGRMILGECGPAGQRIVLEWIHRLAAARPSLTVHVSPRVDGDLEECSALLWKSLLLGSTQCGNADPAKVIPPVSLVGGIEGMQRIVAHG